jgi:hypothetical protein
MHRQTSALLLTVAIAGLAGTLLVAPPSRAGRATHSAARGCASLQGLLAFHGHASIEFSKSASGDDLKHGGAESVAVHRDAYALVINLTPKIVSTYESGRYVFFAGKATGGEITVKDTWDGTTQHGALHYDGAVSTALPNPGATLIFDRVACQYVFETGYAVKAKYSGDDALRPYTTVVGSAVGLRYGIPANLQLHNADYPDAGAAACQDPIQTGNACYSFSGGWSHDFATLYKCHSLLPQGNCATDNNPAGNAIFGWSLFPVYAK